MIFPGYLVILLYTMILVTNRQNFRRLNIPVKLIKSMWTE